MTTIRKPEPYGISSERLLSLVKAMETQVEDMHSIAVVCDDDVLFYKCKEPYTDSCPQMMHSFSKSINSLAVGIALEEGKLSLDDHLADFFIEDMPEQYDPRVKELTVRNLLTMAASSCQFSSYFLNAEGSWITYYLGLELPHDPGTVFQYDTGASYMLSCLVTKVMGKTVFALIKDRVFEPMGITDVHWLESPEGNTVGGWGLYLTTSDIAKIAILLANMGRWKGQQLIPESYLKEATRKQIDTFAEASSPYGYGYQFWIGPENSFCVFGAFGNNIIVNPEKRLAVAVTAGSTDRLGNPSTIVDVVSNEEFLIPSDRTPLPDNPATFRALTEYLDSLRLPTPDGDPVSLLEDELFNRHIVLRENDRNLQGLYLTRKAADEIEIIFTLPEQTVSVRAGYHRWIYADTIFDNPLHHEHSFSYAWQDEHTLVIRQYLLNTSAYDQFTLHFEGAHLTGEAITTVKIGGTHPTPLDGIIEA